MKIGAKGRISHPQALDKSRATALVESPRCEQQLPVRRLGGLGEFVVAKNPENQQTDPQVSAQESPCRHLFSFNRTFTLSRTLKRPESLGVFFVNIPHLAQASIA